MPETSTPRRELRPEIQGLRAVAVALVVVHHLWPEALTGGFIGVDVFFAISGYLITAHLLRGIARDGRVRLGAFWVRRARRILPAALLVLGCTLAATVALVPARPPCATSGRSRSRSSSTSSGRCCWRSRPWPDAASCSAP